MTDQVFFKPKTLLRKASERTLEARSAGSATSSDILRQPNAQSLLPLQWR